MSSKKQADKPKRRVGRPSKPLDTERLKKELADGATKEEAYENQNMNVNYANRLEKKNVQLGEAVKEGVEEFKEKFATSIKPMLITAYRQKVLDGDVAAILFGMKTIVGFREGIKHEVSGEIQHIHSLTPEDRAKRIAALRAELDAQVVDVAIEDSTEDGDQGKNDT